MTQLIPKHTATQSSFATRCTTAIKRDRSDESRDHCHDEILKNSEILSKPASMAACVPIMRDSLPSLIALQDAPERFMQQSNHVTHFSTTVAYCSHQNQMILWKKSKSAMHPCD